MNKIDNIIISLDYSRINDAIEDIDDKNISDLFRTIPKNFFSVLEKNKIFLLYFKKYVSDIKIRGTDHSKYAIHFLDNFEKFLNKSTIGSKHRDTRIRRISEKNTILRFLKVHFEYLVKLFTLIDNAIEFRYNIKESQSNISKDILSISGAGQDGTDTLRKKYQKDTPGQLKEDQCQLYSYEEIKDLEKFADRLLNQFNVDIAFTKHFGERLSNDRNRPCIKLDELKSLFKRISATRAEKIKNHPNGEYVIQDLQKDLNLPVVVEFKRGEFDVIVKTIMRKKNFMSSNPKIRVESFKSIKDRI
uniref:Uncharacterized protein n=1 Tax=viral metagenome TaxID=1070528 RepID=A0A6C0JYF0_9ZZZZ